MEEREFLERIEKHKGIIFKISKMYMDNREDQEDLFQEIVFQVWKSYPSFQNNSAFSTWMYRVAINTAIVFLRSDKKRNFVNHKEEIENFSHLPYQDTSSEKEEQLQRMYEAIQKLNPIDKALIFYYLEDLSGKEIALQMGISEGNVRVKLNRAKQKLKELIQKSWT